MHMSDALLSPAVGITLCAASTAAAAYSVKKIKKDDLCEKKIPIMGIMGAFIFAAQMINFTIPATGSSGHIGGGILLAAMIGSYPALLSITAVLIIQCLFFADGGLLALGCNIFNLGVIPCLVVYPLLFVPFVKKGMAIKNITIASIAAVVVGLQLGAFGVVLQTLLSGITELPFTAFLLLMLPIHLAIGIMEGIITAAILCFVCKMRPEILQSAYERTAVNKSVSIKNVVIALVCAAVLAGGVLSLFVSQHPDGLEWSIEKIMGTKELEPKNSPLIEGSAAIQETTAFMPDYDFKETAKATPQVPGTSVAGIVGGIITFLLAWAAAITISIIKNKKKRYEK